MRRGASTKMQCFNVKWHAQKMFWHNITVLRLSNGRFSNFVCFSQLNCVNNDHKNYWFRRTKSSINVGKQTKEKNSFRMTFNIVFIYQWKLVHCMIQIPFNIWKIRGKRSDAVLTRYYDRLCLQSRSSYLLRRLKKERMGKAGKWFLVSIFCLYKVFVLKNALPQRAKHSCKSHLKFICVEALQWKSSPVQNSSHFKQ